MRRFFLLGAVLVAGFALGAPRARAAIDGNAAAAFVNQAVEEALKTFNGKPMAHAEKTQKAEALIGRYSDLRVLSAAILGRYWTSATPAQQQKFPTLLVDYALSAWAPMGDLGAGDNKIQVVRAEPAGTNMTVHAVAGSPGEQPTPLDFTVSTGQAGRLIITDVVVDHVSFITTMRDDFTSFLRSNGGSVDALMSAMQKKIDANAGAK